MTDEIDVLATLRASLLPPPEPDRPKAAVADTLMLTHEVAQGLCRQAIGGRPGCACKGDPEVCFAMFIFGDQAVACLRAVKRAGYNLVKRDDG